MTKTRPSIITALVEGQVFGFCFPKGMGESRTSTHKELRYASSSKITCLVVFLVFELDI